MLGLCGEYDGTCLIASLRSPESRAVKTEGVNELSKRVLDPTHELKIADLSGPQHECQDIQHFYSFTLLVTITVTLSSSVDVVVSSSVAL